MTVEYLLMLIPALLIVLTVHEASHALVAYYLGDPTAKIRGRLTLNPVAHLDLVGSLVFLFTMRFGWGKPVPVNPGNFKNPVRDSAYTALAGPVSNFILAFGIAFLIKYLAPYSPVWLAEFFHVTFSISVILGIFNLLPFPPLDGSKILGLFIPKRWHRQYANFLEGGLKYFVAIILIDAFVLRDFLGFSILGYVIGFLYEIVATILLLGS